MGRDAEQKARRTMVYWESDQLIIVWERESRLHGEGVWRLYWVCNGHIHRTCRAGYCM